jgi:gliding motility-associated lipoprotein GldH
MPGKISLIVLVTGFLLMVYACDKSVMYDESHHVKNSVWNIADTLFFEFDVVDSTIAYDFAFNIRNTTSYSYQNLFLFITARYPDGNYSRDTAECILAAPDGRWLGKGSGKLRDSQLLFRKAVHFRKSGHYIIGVTQAMRTDDLEGISDVGIRITKSGN